MASTQWAKVLGWLKAAGEDSRLRLLALCARQDLSVSDLAEALRQSEPRVSRHLRILCEAGLLERLRQGQWVHYRLTQNAAAAGFVQGLLAQLDRNDPVFVRDRERAFGRPMAAANTGVALASVIAERGGRRSADGARGERGVGAGAQSGVGEAGRGARGGVGGIGDGVQGARVGAGDGLRGAGIGAGAASDGLQGGYGDAAGGVARGDLGGSSPRGGLARSGGAPADPAGVGRPWSVRGAGDDAGRTVGVGRSGTASDAVGAGAAGVRGRALESKLGKALREVVEGALGGHATAAPRSALVVGVEHLELLEAAAAEAGECVAIAHSRRAAQGARAFAERRGFACRVLLAASSEALCAKDVQAAGGAFDMVFLDHLALPESGLESLLTYGRRALAEEGRLWLFERYDSLEVSREKVVEHPIGRLRRILGDVGLACERLSPIEADGEHVLAAVAVPSRGVSRGTGAGAA